MRQWRRPAKKAKPRTAAASIFVRLQLAVFVSVGGNPRFLAAAPAMRFLGPLRLIITVVVCVVVVVLVVFEIDVVKDDTQNSSAYADDGLLHTREHGAWETPVLHHDYGLINFAGDNRSVTHTQNRRRIEEHDIVTHSQFGDGVGHALPGE